MSDLDLEKLAAPVASLKGEVIEAYKKLDRRWTEVAQCLSELTIPCDVSYQHWFLPAEPSFVSCLEWRRHKGKKRICIVSYDLSDQDYEEYAEVIPYEEWSANQRLAMLKHVPELFVAAEKAVARFIADANGGEQ